MPNSCRSAFQEQFFNYLGLKALSSSPQKTEDRFLDEGQGKAWSYYNSKGIKTSVYFCGCANCPISSRLKIVSQIITALNQDLQTNRNAYRRINVISLGSQHLGQELLLGKGFQHYWTTTLKQPLPTSWHMIDPHYSDQSIDCHASCAKAFKKALGQTIGGEQTRWSSTSEYLAAREATDSSTLNICLNIDPLISPRLVLATEASKSANAIFVYNDGTGPATDALFNGKATSVGPGAPDTQRLMRDCEAYIMVSSRSVRVVIDPSQTELSKRIRSVVLPLLNERATVAAMINALQENFATDKKPTDIAVLSDQAVDYRNVLETLDRQIESQRYAHVTDPQGHRIGSCDNCTCHNVFVGSMKHNTGRTEVVIKAPLNDDDNTNPGLSSQRSKQSSKLLV